MAFVRIMGGILVISALALGVAQAMDDDSYSSQPLIQADFNRLVPITYPLLDTQFNRLKPTSFPVIQPGVARVHIIERLVRPMEQPLLRTY